MTHLKPAPPTGKWSKAYWVDLGERVGAVTVYEATALLVASVAGINTADLWPVYGLPIALSFLKGLAANLVNPESGASLLPAPPGPEVQRDPSMRA